MCRRSTTLPVRRNRTGRTLSGKATARNAYTANPPIPIRWDANPAIATPAVCSNGLLPDALMNTRYKDFAPRFGIAYSPDSKTVIRTGFGIFYSQDNANSPYFDLARNLAARISYIANTPWDGNFSNINAPASYANAFPATPVAQRYMSRRPTPTLTTLSTTRLILCSTCSTSSASSATAGPWKSGISGRSATTWPASRIKTREFRTGG